MKILLVDSDKDRRVIFKQALEPENVLVGLPSAQEAFERVANEHFQLIFCRYEDPHAEELLRKTREGERPAFFISIIETEDDAVKAVARRKHYKGADSFIYSRVTIPDIRKAVPPLQPGPALENAAKPDGQPPETSEQMEKVISWIAANDRPVLICGEPGTGKRTLARRIHSESARARAGGTFEVFHCARLNTDVAESELFGYVKGAFSWAVSEKTGLFERADQGSLLVNGTDRLDEPVQRILLKVLEDPLMRVQRLGAAQSISVDVRLIGTTDNKLQKNVGSLSADLAYALSENYIELAPLRARMGKLDDFLIDFGVASGEIAPEAKEILQQYSWPGNFMELKMAVRYALARFDTQIQKNHLPAYILRAVSRGTCSQTSPAV